jgi:hypothetical protein
LNPVDASNQNRSLGDEQLDDSIVDTLVSVDGFRYRRKAKSLDIALEVAALVVTGLLNKQGRRRTRYQRDHRKGVPSGKVMEKMKTGSLADTFPREN